MADIDLPVFSFRPNWREGVTERLAFLTDVMRADEGIEQRRILRSTPRRTLEADFLLTGAERTFLDLFINRLGSGEMMIPLYWETVRLKSATVAGTTDRIAFDATRREFAPGLALLIRDSALDYEVIQIAAVDAAGIDLVVPTVRKWPVGTLLLPLRRGVIDDFGSPSHPAGGIATVTMRHLLTEANPWTVGGAAPTAYLGNDIFSAEPNWVEPMNVEIDRPSARLDNQTGNVYQREVMSRALLAQSHRWFLKGRERQAAFRDLTYRYKGRGRSFWLPTFRYDLKLAAPCLAVATQIEVENVGLGYTGAPHGGREYILISHATGSLIRRITNVLPGTTSATEKLDLDAAVGLALAPGQVRRISFADLARFDQDEFEITHHGPVDGLAEASGTFKTLRTARGTVVNVNAQTRSATTVALGLVNGLLVGGFTPDQVIYLSLPPGQTYTAWRPQGNNLAFNYVNVIPDDDITRAFRIGPTTLYQTAEEARASFPGGQLTGASSYRLFFLDTPINDNQGGLSILFEIYED